MAIASIPGTTTKYNPSFGGVPTVPDPGQTAGAAISANLGNLGSIYNLGKSIDAFNTSQLQTTLGSLIPNYIGMMGQQSGDIGSQLAGRLPQDVVNTVIQNAAERGIATGMPGSDNANTAMLRALGLSSLDLENMGMKNLATAIGETPLPKFFDPSSMLVNPEELQSAQSAANMYASAPNPMMAAGAAIGAANAGVHNAPGVSMPQFGTTRTYAGPGGIPGPTFASDNMGTVFPSGGQPAVPAAEDPYAAWKQWSSAIPTSTANQAGGNWYWDSVMGAYVNSLTGDTSDKPGGAPLPFTWQGANTPAEEDPYAVPAVE